jgi:alcohol dehydrogenase (NADP+)
MAHLFKSGKSINSTIHQTDSFSAPDSGGLPPINAFTLLGNGIKVGGSGIGSPTEIAEMLQFAQDKKIHPMIQKRPMTDANQAILDLDAGKARYRYVLVNEKHV